MKRFIILVLFAMFSFAIFSQGTLPLNYNYLIDGSNYPTGMTTVGGGFSTGVKLDATSESITFHFTPTEYDKLAEFRFRFGNETGQYLAIIQESENGIGWTNIDSVGTMDACSKTYVGMASTKLGYVAVPLSKDAQYVKITYVSAIQSFYLTATSIRKDYRKVDFDADFSTISSPGSDAITRTNGTITFKTTTNWNMAGKAPDSIQVSPPNYYYYNGNSATGLTTHAVWVTLDNPIPADGGAVEYYMAHVGGSAATVFTYDMTNNSPVLLRRDTIVSDKKHGTYVKIDLPGGVQSFAISRGTSETSTSNKAFHLLGIKTYVTNATAQISTKLSDLTIGGTTIDGFNKNITDYTIYTNNDSEEEAPEI
ncbi:MAG: hypothetical protein LBG17_02755, partial [Bacteroidales bacterium]|nr:hypothetical protein [Bacteroidales bacterium]